MKITDEMVIAAIHGPDLRMWVSPPEMRRVLEYAVGDLPEPIDLTQLPAYIELQKRLALAEAKLEEVRRLSEPNPYPPNILERIQEILDDKQ